MTGPELAFLYLFGLLDALQLKYNIRVLVCALVYTHISVLDNAKSEPAELFITYLHACRRSCRTTSTRKTYAALPLVPPAAECVHACVRANACDGDTTCDGMHCVRALPCGI